MRLQFTKRDSVHTRILQSGGNLSSGPLWPEKSLTGTLLATKTPHEGDEDVARGSGSYWIFSALLDPYRLAGSPTLGATLASLDVFLTPALWGTREEFVQAMHRLFESEPFEDGIRHPAETRITNALNVDHRARDWIRVAVLENFDDSLAADLLRCLGRLKLQTVGNWGLNLAEAALLSASVNVRDGAMQALESWGSPSLNILRAHQAREQTPWLREYLEQVINDLRA